MSCDLHVAKSDRYSQHIINRNCFLSISECTPLSSELATQKNRFFSNSELPHLRFRNPNLPKGACETKGGSQSSRGDATGFVGILGQRNVFEDPPFFRVSQVERKKAKELEEKQRLAKEETLRKEKEAKQKKKEAHSAAMGRCICYLWISLGGWKDVCHTSKAVSNSSPDIPSSWPFKLHS